MVLDTSALVAILQEERESEAFVDEIERAPTRLMSAATLAETSIVVLSRQEDAGLSLLRRFLADIRVEIVPLAAAQVDLAIDGFRRFGKGRHPAGLNFGDCFSYALAMATGEPLLFKGDDFARTDVARAAA